jgi:hypothetical protein
LSSARVEKVFVAAGVLVEKVRAAISRKSVERGV